MPTFFYLLNFMDVNILLLCFKISSHNNLSLINYSNYLLLFKYYYEFNFRDFILLNFNGTLVQIRTSKNFKTLTFFLQLFLRPQFITLNMSIVQNHIIIRIL